MVKVYQKGVQTRLGPHFLSTEFDCKCSYPECTLTYVDDDLVYKLEKKRVRWGEAIHLLSGFRCTRHNQAVGGKAGSQHLQGKAADVRVDKKPPHEVADDCEDFDGLGRYESFTHVDVRGYRARWFG